MDALYLEKLFSYGTLKYPTVQLATFGRLLTGAEDVLTGFIIKTINIEDPSVVAKSGEKSHPVIHYTGEQADKVVGVVFDITAEELKQADAYEAIHYKRIKLQLISGIATWIYVDKNSEIE